MTTETDDIEEFEPWYKYGVAILYFEMFLAIALTIFALYLTFSGSGGISKR
ncbi:MAG: hypothetical protein GPJ54_03085 [Candidatus Heimdallarchaeota archaeon]|nr:hypothetical protein [Candidatus Heimdallarchaeota archaeon]